MAAHDYRGDIDLPELPDIPYNAHTHSTNIINPQQFTRKNLKLILHLITGELKKRGTKTPHIFLPYRSKVDDTKLELFLRRIFPNGELIPLQSKQDERSIKQTLENFDEFTLICSLKYLWSRLPNNEIIGWDVYLEFKRREKEAGYPKSAFLSIMPKCLSSPAHASIVYDFLDLLISLASNSQYNYLSGRKIAKMSSLWAFNGYSRFSRSAFYDATMNNEHNFMEGLDAWKSSSEALFHLLLSFLRAMLPESENDTLKLPKTLQSLLITNSYPPQKSTDSMKSLITIPCVYVRSTKKSANVYELISKVRHTLSFDKKDTFLSVENYTILKNIFRKKSTTEIVDTLTEESRRILSRLTSDPIESEYDIYPGWPKTSKEADDGNIPLFSQISIHDVSLQDYYIWTWLSSIGSDQTHHMKNLFGRSLVVEAGLRGFQKWLIITEELMSADEYIHHFKLEDTGSSPLSYTFGADNEISTTQIDTPPLVPQKTRATSGGDYKEAPLPPLPSKDISNVNTNSGILPNYSINTKLDMSQVTGFDEEDDYVYPSEVNAERENDDYRQYLDQLSDRSRTPRSISNSNASNTRRPPPPPLDFLETKNPGSGMNSNDSKHRLNHEIFNSRFEADKPKAVVPNGNVGLPGDMAYFSPSSHAYREPYDEYETEADKLANLRINPPSEPYDNYYVSGADSPDPQPAREAAHVPEPTVGPPTEQKETKEEKEERRRRKRERKERKKREEAEQQAAVYGFTQALPPGVLPNNRPVFNYSDNVRPNGAMHGSVDNLGLRNGAIYSSSDNLPHKGVIHVSVDSLPPNGMNHGSADNLSPNGVIQESDHLPPSDYAGQLPDPSKIKDKKKKKKKHHKHHQHHQDEPQKEGSYAMMTPELPQGPYANQIPDVTVSNMGYDGRPASDMSYYSASPGQPYLNANYNYGVHPQQLHSPPASANRHSHEQYTGGEAKPQRSSAPETYQGPGAGPYYQQFPPQGMTPPGRYSQEHLAPVYGAVAPIPQQPFGTQPMTYGYSTSPQQPGFQPSPQQAVFQISPQQAGFQPSPQQAGFQLSPQMIPQHQGYYGNPSASNSMPYLPMQQQGSPMRQPMGAKPKSPTKYTTSDFAVMNMPTVGTKHRNAKTNKANLRATLNQGGFGI